VAVENPDRWAVGRTGIFYNALLCTLEFGSLHAKNLAHSLIISTVESQIVTRW
jgi:hypothetical protein